MNLITRSAIAVAVSAALGATAAHALDRNAEYDAAVKVYFGGATATDNTLEEVFITNTLGICDPVAKDIDIYRTNANQRVVTCRVTAESAAAAGIGTHGFAARGAGGEGTGGTLIAFHKESQGGSSNGVVPLITVAKGQAHALRWFDVGQLGAADCVTSTVAVAGLITYTNHSACPTTMLTPVDTAGSAGAAGTFDIHGGISDNEPAVAYPPPAGDAARLLSNPGLAIVFGVPVTTKLYRALQQTQFGVGSACDGNDTLESCVPSLTRSQVRSLYNQTITDWSVFKNAAGTAMTALATDPPADTGVRICRRVASSGTQASYETYWLHERCTVLGAIAPFAGPDDDSTVDDTVYSANQFAAGSLVNAAPSSGNVRSCFLSANTGDFWAVGVLSTEVTDSNYNSGNAGFRFVAVDGAAPNLKNVANGDYDFFTENTVNRVSNTFAGNVGAIADGTPTREIVELIDERLSNQTVLINLNNTFDARPWGNGGVLALSSFTTPQTAPYTDADMTANPVNTQSRNGNSCMPPTMVKQSPIAP
jgi:ABC-type phosphate transport system substrate-binding protein